MSKQVIAVKYTVKEDKVEKFLPLIAEMAKSSLNEPNCLNYEFSRDENEFFLYEKYENEKAFKYHISTDHYKKYIEETKDLIADKRVDKYIAL
jgi:quinol monooxygenase YgiN